MATQTLKIQIGDLVRDMTDEEIAQQETDTAEHAKWLKTQADRASLKTATLEKLGLTAEEVASLLS